MAAAKTTKKKVSKKTTTKKVSSTAKKKATTQKKATSKREAPFNFDKVTKELRDEVIKTGRPSKWRDEFNKIAVEAMARGFSKNAVAGCIGISKETLYRWIREKPDFNDSIKIGQQLSEHWWESQAIRNLCRGKEFATPSWIFNMKNRFGWTDKKEIEMGEKTRREFKLAYSLDEETDDENQENN